MSGYELKRIMRTGTVATIDNRNWELRDHREPVQRLLPVAGHRPRHGIGDRRRQRLPLPRALRHAAVRLRQAAARRTEAAGHGFRLLSPPGGAAPRNRGEGDGEASLPWNRSVFIRGSSGASPRPRSSSGIYRWVTSARRLPLGSRKKAIHSSMPFLPRRPSSSRWTIAGFWRNETPRPESVRTAASMSSTMK